MEPVSKKFRESNVRTSSALSNRSDDLDLDMNGDIDLGSTSRSLTSYKLKGNKFERTDNGHPMSYNYGSKLNFGEEEFDDEWNQSVRRRARTKAMDRTARSYSLEPEYGRLGGGVSPSPQRRGLASTYRSRTTESAGRETYTPSDWGRWESDKTAQVRGRTLDSVPLRREFSSSYTSLNEVGTVPRARSVDLYRTRSDVDLEVEDMDIDTIEHVPLRKSRATSMPRGVTGVAGVTSVRGVSRMAMTPSSSRATPVRSMAVTTRRRAHSVSRIESESDIDIPFKHRKVNYDLTPRFLETEPEVSSRDYRFEIRDLERDRHKGRDISTYVIPYGEKFEPDSVQVRKMDNGRRQVTYLKQSTRGHGDAVEANKALDLVVQRTKFMQDSMHTLEAFVKRNRSLFPEDTMVHQTYRFYLLSEEELRAIGEPLDAEVYGVKITEKLIVPYGCDVAHLLKRYYEKHDKTQIPGRRHGSQIEYEDEHVIDTRHLRDNIRTTVEREYDERNRTRYQGYKRKPRDVNDPRNEYPDLHTYFSPTYLKSFNLRGEPGDYP